MTRTETVQVTGIRCERCVQRLGAALRGHDGLEFANATLLGSLLLPQDYQQLQQCNDLRNTAGLQRVTRYELPQHLLGERGAPSGQREDHILHLVAGDDLLRLRICERPDLLLRERAAERGR